MRTRQEVLDQIESLKKCILLMEKIYHTAPRRIDRKRALEFKNQYYARKDILYWVLNNKKEEEN